MDGLWGLVFNHFIGKQSTKTVNKPDTINYKLNIGAPQYRWPIFRCESASTSAEQRGSDAYVLGQTDLLVHSQRTPQTL